MDVDHMAADTMEWTLHWKLPIILHFLCAYFSLARKHVGSYRYLEHPLPYRNSPRSLC
jgi:hypothetical protein